MKYIHGSNQFKKTVKVSVKSEVKRVMKEVGKVIAGLSFMAGSIMGIYGMGSAATSAQMVYADVPVPTATMPDIPVLDRIAKCENSGSQYAKNGQIGYHINTNGTIDVGMYEINSIWFSTATKMGYDLTKPADNKSFAEYLYLNYGTTPWNDSSSCWLKN